MTENISFPVATRYNQYDSVELSKDYYRYLVEDGGVSPKSTAVLIAAAQILDETVAYEARSFGAITDAIHDDRETKPSATERRAMTALVNAELVYKVGAGPSTGYLSPGRRVR